MTPWELAKSGTEHAEQRAFFAWANCAELYGFGPAGVKETYSASTRQDALDAFKIAGELMRDSRTVPIPALKWIHAIHNQGHGDAIRGGRARAEGVKPGVWDIFWPLPKLIPSPPPLCSVEQYHGLYIEMKRRARANQDALSIDQKEFREYANRHSYMTCVCFSWTEAAESVRDYYEGR